MMGREYARSNILPFTGGLALSIGALAGIGHFVDMDYNVGGLHIYTGLSESTLVKVGQPKTSIFEQRAFAVAKLIGTLPLHGRYNDVRPGPIPNCKINIDGSFPFLAEMGIDIKHIKVEQSVPDSNGKYTIKADVENDFEIFNPRAKLDKATMSGDTGGFDFCTDGPAAELISDLWHVAGGSVGTATACVSSAFKDDTTYRPFIVQNLTDDLKAMYPNAKSVEVNLPPGEEIHIQDPARDRLQSIIDEIHDKNSDFTVDAKPVQDCTFKSLELDVAAQPTKG